MNMERLPVVEIHTVDDIHKLLLHQKVINRRASLELNAIADKLPLPDTEEAEMKIAYQAIELEAQLLDKYSKYPTLTQFATSPTLRNLTQWGATFAVALVVGEVILRHIRSIQQVFPKAQRHLFTLMLLELSDPVAGDGDIAAALCQRMVVEVREDAHLSEAARKKTVYDMMAKLVYTMLSVAVEYKLVELREDSFLLTDMGRRTLLHLVDASRFIEDVAAAHKRLQGAGDTPVI